MDTLQQVCNTVINITGLLVVLGSICFIDLQILKLDSFSDYGCYRLLA